MKDCWKVVDGELCGDTDNVWGGELVLSMGGRNRGQLSVSCDVKFIEAYNPGLDDTHAAIGIRPEIDNDIEPPLVLDGTTFRFSFAGTTIISRLQGKTAIKQKHSKDGFIAKMNNWYHLNLIVINDNAVGYVDSKYAVMAQRDMPGFISPSLSFSSAHVHFDNIILVGEAIPTKHARTTITWGKLKSR